MKVPGLNSGFVIFILFFGISLIDALQTMSWLLAGFWLTIGVAFYVLDSRRKSEIV
jgi:hypothetical protein